MKENQYLKTVQNEVVDLKAKLESLKAVEMENKKLNGIVLEKDKELEKMQSVLKRERDEKMDLLHDQEKLGLSKEEENKKLLEENERLRKELSIAGEKLKVNQRGAEENLKNRLEQEKDLLLHDQDQDRGAYQRLLKDYHELEEHAETLEKKLAVLEPGHSRSLSNASSGSGQIVATELPPDDHNIVRLYLLFTDNSLWEISFSNWKFYCLKDFGYGSVRSTASSTTPYSRVETIDWNQQRSDSPPDGETQSAGKSPPETNGPTKSPIDVGLVLKLQQKLKDVEKANGRLVRMVEDLERDTPEETSRTQDSFRVSHRSNEIF